MRNRRRFLAELGLAGAASALVPGVGCAQKRSGPAAPAPGRARVVLVHGPSLAADARTDRALIRRMLEEGLRRLASAQDTRTALLRWVKPADTVGLKVNCMAGRFMSTHVELVEELVGLLEGAGLPRQQSVVFDRADADLRRGGFTIRGSGKDYRCVGNDSAGFEPELTLMPSGASRLSMVATRTASVLINLPVLKDHGLAGLSGALKNNFGLVHNPNKYHLNGCDPHVAEVNALPVVRSKQRLVICDALRVQTDGGPAYHPAAAVGYGGILLATDPVALDVVLWEILEDLRRKRKLPTLEADKRKPVHVLTAGQMGLGQADRKGIDLIEAKVS